MQQSEIQPVDGIRIGLLMRTVLTLGLLSLLIIVVAFVALWSLSRIRETAVQAVEVDGRMSRLASEVALRGQISRRYLADYLATIDYDPGINSKLLDQSLDDLDRAVGDFEQAARTSVDLRQAQLWRAAFDLYREGVTQVEQGVTNGTLTTSVQARHTFGPFSENIVTLTDLAVTVGEEKDYAAMRSAGALHNIGQSAVALVLGVSGLAIGVALVATLFVPHQFVKPVIELRQAALRLAGGELDARAAVVRHDEIGDLAASFNRMATTIEQRTGDLEAQYQAAEHARAEAEQAHCQIVAQLDTIAAQRAIIGELAVPILPLSDGTLVMPLVGALDSTRLEQVKERALHAIEQQATRHLILDITGVPMVDTQVAQGLIQVVQAARLLGTQAVLVGIRPEVAQTIVGLGISLEQVTTRSTLQSGIAYTQGRGQGVGVRRQGVGVRV